MKKFLVLLLMSAVIAMPAYAMDNNNNESSEGSGGERVKIIEEVLEENGLEDADLNPGETVLMINEVKKFLKKKSKNPEDQRRATRLVGKLVKKWQEKRRKADDTTTSIEERSKQAKVVKKEMKDFREKCTAWERGIDATAIQTMIDERLGIIRLARQVFEESETSYSPNDNESTVEEELRKEEDKVNLEREKVFEEGGKVLADASEKNKEVIGTLHQSLEALEELYEEIKKNIEGDDQDLGRTLNIIDLIEELFFAMNETYEGSVVAEILAEVQKNQDVNGVEEPVKISKGWMKSLKKKFFSGWRCVIM